MVEYTNLKLRKLRLSKISSVFAVFGLFLGFILGIIWFFLVKFFAESYGLTKVPISGLFILSFIVIPIVTSLLSFIWGFLNGLIFNLSLKVIRGLDVKVQQE